MVPGDHQDTYSVLQEYLADLEPDAAASSSDQCFLTIEGHTYPIRVLAEATLAFVRLTGQGQVGGANDYAGLFYGYGVNR